MWIFTNKAMISVVQKPGDKDMLTVRARVKGDIERVFPGAKVTANAGTDYAYRARVHRVAVANVISNLILEIGYPNFKNSIRSNDHHDLCAGVWRVGFNHQERMAPKRRARGARQAALDGFGSAA